MKKLFLAKNSKTAFSLIELSIVIVVISVLITGALSVTIGSFNNSKVKTTNDRIQTIYKALGVFLLENGRLPCPASIIESKASDSTYGQEVGTAGTCTGTGIYVSTSATDISHGMVPVNALGLPNIYGEDGFGTKFSYFVDKNFTSSSTFGSATSTSTITIEDTLATTVNTVTDDAIFVIVSHGVNKAGGYNSTSSSQNTRSSDTDEQDNDNGGSPYTGFDNDFVMESTDSDDFDDIVFFKTRNDLLQDFNALHLVTCESGTVSTYTMPTGYYNQRALSSSDCGSGDYPQIKCGAFGNWASWVDVECP